MIVGVIVIGDPFCATTHTDFYLRAVNHGIKVKVIHNASIINAVFEWGLFSYRFGQTISIPFFTEKWRPYSFYDMLKINYENNMHTLWLLDLKIKEPT